MPKNKSPNRRGRQRRLRIRSDLRRQPDLQKIANTVQALALAQAEKEAQAQAEATKKESADE